ncbi:MAG TPA: pyrroloquinoline quinone biosynthesis protein PqqE [Candidatus Dormibacteraeota bacterium]|jgi:pyrroloquinoline quinone biosynthesis protein E|nr:pyrroloquinoline quinone biosynthesis protein PqqE [Candidatus Dormibacteraeota bacterium]
MIPNPLALIAEITHRCPLHCVYCSNPLELAAVNSELSTQEWIDVFQQAGKLGMLHAHFTGGEPLARPDLTELIAGARAAGLYTNLITSGLGLAEPRLQALVEAGLDHIQLSFQDSREDSANWIAGARAHTHKIELSRIIRSHKLAFTVNLVIHRQNIDHLEEMIAFIEQLAPERMEIAHTQYYGWALQNRAALLPTRAQLDRAVETVAAAETRLAGRIRVDSVVPDYYARYPKACMGGWGRRLMLINPAGKVLPCHAAEIIPGLEFENVLKRSLEYIWQESSSFQCFRGEEWMPEPCRSCDRRTEDFGGCRCQALLLTGDVTATDPACSLAPAHHIVEAALIEANSTATTSQPVPAASFVQLQKLNTDLWSYRTNPE